MSAFDRTVLWVNDVRNYFRPDGTLGERGAKVAGWNGGNISDLMLPATVTRKQMDALRNISRPGGAPHASEGVTKLRCHIQLQASPRTAQQIAADTDTLIGSLLPGIVDWDVEVCFRDGEAAQEQYIREAVAAFRVKHPTFLLGINVPPFKGSTLPVDVFESDKNLWAIEQTYYGEMDPVAQMDAWNDIPAEIRAAGRAKLCVGAATERRTNGTYDPNGRREPNLGSIQYKGRYTGSKVGAVEVFTDDLMLEVGYLT